MARSFIRSAMMGCGLLCLAACGSNDGAPPGFDYGGKADSISRSLGKGSPYGGTNHATRSVIGKPYTIRGRTFYPKYQPNYSKTGLASWYGPGFHGRKTANGEQYDQYEMTRRSPYITASFYGACNAYQLRKNYYRARE